MLDTHVSEAEQEAPLPQIVSADAKARVVAADTATAKIRITAMQLGISFFAFIDTCQAKNLHLSQCLLPPLRALTREPRQQAAVAAVRHYLAPHDGCCSGNYLPNDVVRSHHATTNGRGGGGGRGAAAAAAAAARAVTCVACCVLRVILEGPTFLQFQYMTVIRY